VSDTKHRSNWHCYFYTFLLLSHKLILAL
jgi:hypothetical protein